MNVIIIIIIKSRHNTVNNIFHQSYEERTKNSSYFTNSHIFFSNWHHLTIWFLLTLKKTSCYLLMLFIKTESNYDFKLLSDIKMYVTRRQIQNNGEIMRIDSS